MPLDDLREFFDAPTLTLPVGGRKYVVKACTAATWLRLQTIADNPAGAAEVDMDLYRMVLGKDLLDDMMTHVTGPELRRVGITAWLWQLGNENAATTFWASGGKAPEAEASTPTKTPRTTRTGGVTTTRRRASGTGTSTRKRSSSAAKA